MAANLVNVVLAIGGHRRLQGRSQKERKLAGTFEIVSAGQGTFRFRLTADDGTVVAVSPSFPNIKAVTAGITAVRENAATGFVVDRRASLTSS